VTDNGQPFLSLRRCHKAITTADRRNLQVQRSMLRMTTIIQHIRVSLLALNNRHKHLGLCMMLAKVAAKSALSAVNCLHKILLFSLACYPVQTPHSRTALPAHKSSLRPYAQLNLL
jgi:hypothetical protein